MVSGGCRGDNPMNCEGGDDNEDRIERFCDVLRGYMCVGRQISV